MFENELSAKFKRIFGVKKVTFDEPGESREQECIFISIDMARNTIKDGRQISRVSGEATMFASNDKLPFGFFSKHIAKADPNDTKDLFFQDFESNTKRYRNLVQRSFNFVYFFSGQYDPNIGSITDIAITEEP